jgi:hypothetical protein
MQKRQTISEDLGIIYVVLTINNALHQIKEKFLIFQRMVSEIGGMSSMPLESGLNRRPITENDEQLNFSAGILFYISLKSRHIIDLLE